MSAWVQTLRQLTSPGGIEGLFAVKYAEFARDTPAMREEYRRLAADVAAAVQSGTILEIGPGPGFVAIEIACLLPQVRVIGLDLSATMVDLATRNAREMGVSGQVEFRQGDASKMPFEDGSFDLVVSSGSLHHWKEPTHILSEIWRVLKPGCRALVSDVRGDAPKEEVQAFAAQIASRFMRWGLRHSFAEGYTAPEARRLAEGIPFSSLGIEPRGISMAVWLTK